MVELAGPPASLEWDHGEGEKVNIDSSSVKDELHHDLRATHYGFPVAQLVKNLPAMWGTWVGKIPWRRERLLTPLFWPGEFHGLYSPWGGKESNMSERLSLCFHSLRP